MKNENFIVKFIKKTYLYAIEVSKRLLDTKFYNEMFLIT